MEQKCKWRLSIIVTGRWKIMVDLLTLHATVKSMILTQLLKTAPFSRPTYNRYGCWYIWYKKLSFTLDFLTSSRSAWALARCRQPLNMTSRAIKITYFRILNFTLHRKFIFCSNILRFAATSMMFSDFGYFKKVVHYSLAMGNSGGIPAFKPPGDPIAGSRT